MAEVAWFIRRFVLFCWIAGLGTVILVHVLGDYVGLAWLLGCLTWGCLWMARYVTSDG